MKAELLRALSGRWTKLLVFCVALLPLAWLVWGAVTQGLGANPAETLIRSTGDWTLRFLCVALAVTPMRIVLGLPPLARLRRMVGLFVYFYALLHLAAYSWLDMGIDLADISRDIVKRPFILVGFAAFVLLSALAATSFDGAVRTLGGRRWRNLHRLVYLVAPMALLHFFWMRAGKNDFAEVGAYALVLALLLGWRAKKYLNKKGL